MGRRNGHIILLIVGFSFFSTLYLMYTVSTFSLASDNTLTIKLSIPFNRNNKEESDHHQQQSTGKIEVRKSKDDEKNVAPDDNEDWDEDMFIKGDKEEVNRIWNIRKNIKEGKQKQMYEHDNSEVENRPVVDWKNRKVIQKEVEKRPVVDWKNPDVIQKEIYDIRNDYFPSEEYIDDILMNLDKKSKHQRGGADKKLMLMLTPAFETRTWWDTPVDYDMTDLNGYPCLERRCEVTYDRTRFKDSDAVFFHGRDVRDLDSEKLKQLREFNKSQVWIWAFMESPLNLMYDPRPYDFVFNWTATYSIDSDMWTPYFNVVRLKKSERRPKKNFNYAKRKYKMVVGMQSAGCDTYRMKVIRVLRQYVMFDLFGQCSWDFEDAENLPECRKDSDECKDVMSSYKFVFALENSYCDEYVTEKYYQNGLQQELVPIVAISSKFKHKKNYYIPGSYINMLDFKDTRALADHLTYLNGNDTAYNEYFRWRRKYKIIKGPHRACLACHKLWDKEKRKNVKRKSLDLTNFWNIKVCNVWHDVVPKLFLKYTLH